MTRINATIVGADLLADVHVGDELQLAGIARVTGIEEELVNISPLVGDTDDYLPGERTVSLLIKKPTLTPKNAPS